MSLLQEVPSPEAATSLLSEAGRKTRTALWFPDEVKLVGELAADFPLTSEQRDKALQTAGRWVEHLRTERGGGGGGEGPISALLVEYGLSSREGTALMCVAEALLRIPDAGTADALIEGQIGGADWENHLGSPHGWFVNASTRALMMTGGVIAPDEGAPIFRQMVRRLGEPVVRTAVRAAVTFLGGRFVYGKTIDKALATASREEPTLCSFDMLGEAAWTAADAKRYTQLYASAIAALAAEQERQSERHTTNPNAVFAKHGISVKLSALHPRFTPLAPDRFFAEILPRLHELAEAARAADIPFCIDAEEADRLELTLEAVAALALSPALRDWQGLGMAIQAYSPRALSVTDELIDLAKRRGTRLKCRLVKGAYWDTEIKLAQERGVSGYPVFTRKAHTDLSYLACAARLLQAREEIFPCFATHNAHTVAAILELADSAEGWEFQRLHGMGAGLHKLAREELELRFAAGTPSRIYAPIGEYRNLVAYLVRRLLENGANSSFVHRISDPEVPIAQVVQDPLNELEAHQKQAPPQKQAHSPPQADAQPQAQAASGIPLPTDLYLPRRNARGLTTSHPEHLALIERALTELQAAPIAATARLGGEPIRGEARPVVSPADAAWVVGSVVSADARAAEQALTQASEAQRAWRATHGTERAAFLRRAADALEVELPRFVALLAAEAGRTLEDGISEVREAVDFLRYYADDAERLSAPRLLPSPTGEENRLTLEGKGVFFCIAPWNFPLAIFTGQVAAALAAGCAVLAKPAEPTPLVAHEMILLLERAGVPRGVLHFLPGRGAELGGVLLSDSRLAGVAFTGSTEVAQQINRRLAAREGPLATLIAETGGVNAMVADSSALPEQLTRDVLASAFRSAGQRCSALRVLYLQEDSADEQLAMISGATAELRLGLPSDFRTEVGPLISAAAVSELRSWSSGLPSYGAEFVCRADLPGGGGSGGGDSNGYYFAPEVWRWRGLEPPPCEVFGPILHVATWRGDAFGAVLEAINASGYGLTFALHSRALPRVGVVSRGVEAGNIYINRDQIGAVVGVNPFGGRGLSGTGPKAGGPYYVLRFMTERTVTIDTTASGGNASLLAIAS